MKRWLKVYVKVVKNFLSEKKIDEADMEEKFPFRDLVDDEISDDDSSDAEGEGKGEGEGEGEEERDRTRGRGRRNGGERGRGRVRVRRG